MRHNSVAIVGILLLATCSVFARRPVLIVPDGYQGEILLVETKTGGVQWTGAPLIIPPSGELCISDLEALAAVRPDTFDARYAGGQKLQNRNRGGDWKVVGLWPISQTQDDNRTVLIYFVVGTFRTKTDFENYRMKEGWKKTLDRIRNSKQPKSERPTSL